MAEDSKKKSGILTRFRTDQRGNTLAIAAAALIPIAGMIGSGLDMSRAYLVKGRMQQACDAAALAGRQVMTNDTLSQNVVDETERYFDFNFEQTSYGSDAFTIAVTKPEIGTVQVDATTNVPTTLMQIFNYQNIPVTVSCQASMSYINTDVMLVLDVTGSMSGSKIQALRDAVMALYDELAPIQTELTAAGMRLRYGAVPYSENVNVGRLIEAVNPSYLRSNGTFYRPSGCYYNQVRYDISESDCNYYINNGYPSAEWQGGNDWRDRDLSSYIASTSWNGCIEERSTTSSIDGSSGTTIPAAATDLDMGLLPNSDDTRWQPSRPDWHDAISYGGYSCPASAARLGVFTRSEVQSYVNGLNPVGTTYHDIGMIWGTRLMAREGVFAADNPTNYNGMPVNRHLIFMTDGQMNADRNNFTAYGREDRFERVTGGYTNDSDHTTRHNKRFEMICNEAKTQGISVWVVGFGSGGTLTQAMIDCASNASQAEHANNTQDLIDQFVQIGKAIGSLRIVG